MARVSFDFHPFQTPTYPDNLTESEIFGDLSIAVCQNDVDKVKILLSTNASGKIRREYLGILLHHAYSAEIAKELLSCGAYVNVKNFLGDIPLETAILHERRIDLVIELLRHTALIDMSSAAGDTLLIRAIQMKEKCDVKVVEQLLKHGASVHATTIQGKTPLHLAVENGQCVEIITLLLEYGASINAVDNMSLTPLHIAAKSPKSLEVIEIMLKSGTEVGATDRFHQTPLHHAVNCHKNVEITKLLLKYGASPNAPDHQSRTPLHLAAGNGDLMIVKELLDHQALVNCLDCYGEMPLHHAVNKCGNPAVVRELLKHGAIVYVHDRNGDTLLHVAVRSHTDSELVSELLKHGACINGVNLLKETPLHHVVRENENLGIVKLLLKCGAFVHACDLDGQTPLHLAAQGMNLKIVKELLNYEADVCRTDKAGATPLSYAVRNGQRVGIVHLELKMLEAHAGFNLPLDVSTHYNNQLKIVEELLKHGTHGNQTSEKYYELLDFAIGAQDVPCAKLLIKYSLTQTFNDQGKIHLDKYNGSTIYDTLSCHLNKCVCEIEQMQTLKIDCKLSLYKFVATRNINIAFYSNKESVKTITEEDSLATNFPIYYDVIFPKVQDSLARASLLDKLKEFQICSKQCLDERLKNREIILSHDSNLNIFKFLSNDGLRNFIKACNIPQSG